MYTDSHCHLNFPELMSQLDSIQQAMQAAQVTRALCICTTMEDFDSVHGLAMAHDNMWATVGVHPDNEGVREPSLQDLLDGAALPKVVAIGETGLDYYQMEERKGGRTVADMVWQRERFRTHIRAARQTGLPLVIHTRQASDDTIAILKEEGETGGAGCAGVGVCFAEFRCVGVGVVDGRVGAGRVGVSAGRCGWWAGVGVLDRRERCGARVFDAVGVGVVGSGQCGVVAGVVGWW